MHLSMLVLAQLLVHASTCAVVAHQRAGYLWTSGRQGVGRSWPCNCACLSPVTVAQCLASLQAASADKTLST
jgi:hypothetical protein